MKKVRFFSVNFFKNWQAGTCTIYLYIYGIKKMPRLVGGRQPPRAAAARFTFAHTRLSWFPRGLEREKEALVILFLLLIVRAVVAANKVTKMTINQGCHPRRFFKSYIYIHI